MAKLMTFRDLMSRLPNDGTVRHAFRRFNLGMASGAGLPSVVGLARTLGFDVIQSDLPKSIRGRLVADTFAESGFCIEVNQNDDVRTWRWTALHELMHALLHRRDDPFAEPQHRAGKYHFYQENELKEERDANEAVEALVFGENALFAARSMYGADHALLARHFGVSLPTLIIALRKL